MTTFIQTMAGLPGPNSQGAPGEPGYSVFSTWSALDAVTGDYANQAAIVVGDSGTHTDPGGGTVSNSGRFAWSVVLDGWKRIDDYTSTAQTFVAETVQPATPETGAGQDLVRFATPTNPAGLPSPSTTMRVSATHGYYAANSQGFTHPAYVNKTVGLSIGYTNTYAKVDSAEVGMAMIMEHGFHVVSKRPGGGTVKGAEFHWQMTGADHAGYRPITAFSPWTGADMPYDSGMSIQGATIVFLSGGGQPSIQFNLIGDASAAKAIDLDASVAINQAGNNKQWLRQMNPAGNALMSLPYIDGQYHLGVTQPVYMATAAAPANNALGIQSLLTAQGTSGFTTGARLVYFTTNAITGSATCYEAELSASTRFEGFRVRNSHASGTSGGRIIGNGNLYLDFYRETAFKRWGMGLRSDDTFAIGQQEQGVEVADAIRINFTTLQTSFLYPPKLPSYTVAGLPNPTTVGAGSGAYCTNETGGAVPVFSDGTNWRRVTDRTIAA